MRALTVALALTPTLLAAQAQAAAAPQGLLPYRGFHPGVTAAEFETRARALTRAGATPLLCNTSTRTAQVMECGVIIHDPDDGAEFYLSGHFIDGRADVVSFGDSGTSELVIKAQRELRARYGPPHPVGTASWQWRQGAQFVRLTWRARGPRRWIFIQLTDTDVMRGIGHYVPHDTTKKTRP
ncbi:MAG TPA: hypothetical protein VEV39_05025 [Gemmatimonadales bacterium]|nr:hypothetical protein [Gemmatimonadales bacterium]